MTPNPEAFDIEAARHAARDAYCSAKELRQHLISALADRLSQRAAHAQALVETAKAQREAAAKCAEEYNGEGIYYAHLGNAHKTRREIAVAIRQSPLVTEQRGGEKG